MPYVVFDIETVADRTMWQPAPTGSGKGKSRKAPEDQVAPPYAQRPIVIGYATFDDSFTLGAIGAQASDDEVALIRNFSVWLEGMPDATIVSWNGRKFDVPVLSLRALRHGLSQRWLTKDHRARYSEGFHLDLLDVTTEYNALGMTGYTLDTLSALIGLPGKGEMDGSKVEALYEKGDIGKISGYCMCDVARLSFLLLRYKLLRGQLNEEQYRVAAEALWARALEYNLTGVLFGADQTRLLLKPPGVVEAAGVASGENGVAPAVA